MAATVAPKPQQVVKPCPVCGADLPPLTVRFEVGKSERAEGGSLVLPITARVVTSRRAWRAAFRLSHPRCGNGKRIPEHLAA